MLLATIRLKLHFFFHQSLLCHRSTTPQARIAVTMSATHNSNVMSEFRDHVVISSWTNTVSPALQYMLRLTTVRNAHPRTASVSNRTHAAAMDRSHSRRAASAFARARCSSPKGRHAFRIGSQMDRQRLVGLPDRAVMKLVAVTDFPSINVETRKGLRRTVTKAP